MTKVLFKSFLFLFICGNCFSQTNCNWAKDGKGKGPDESNAMCTDKYGNSYITGAFKSDTMVLGSTTLVNYNVNSTYDIFLTKYDPYGNVVWARHFGGVGNDGAYGISCDSAGNNIYITGFFYSTTAIFDTVSVSKGSAGSGSAIFTAKCNSAGSVLWVRSAGNGNGSGGFAEEVTVSPAGYIYVTGTFITPTINFGSVSLSNGSSSSSDVFLVKYDANGNALWGRNSSGASTGSGNYGRSLSTDNNDNVYLTGDFYSSSIKFGTTTYPKTGTNVSMFTVKYDPAGNLMWAQCPKGEGQGSSIVSDQVGNTYILTNVRSSLLIFGSDTLFNPNLTSGSIGLVKYDQGGNVIWLKSGGGRNGQGFMTGKDLWLQGNNLSACGFFAQTGIINVDTIQSMGNTDGFFFTCDTSGNIVGLTGVGGTGGEYLFSISSDPNYKLSITGYYDSPTLVVNSTTFTNSNNNSKIFIAKYCDSSAVTINSYVNESISLKVYPNPSVGDFAIKCESVIDEISIYDLMGQLVSYSKIKDVECHVKIRNRGVYYALVLAGGQCKIARLIVEN